MESVERLWPRRVVETRPIRFAVETRPSKFAVETWLSKFAVDTYPAVPRPAIVEASWVLDT